MDERSRALRALASAVEPFAGQVYFSPECHRAYEGLGFAASPGALKEVALPDSAAYFTSRGSLLGQVPGEVVAAAFAVFNPAVVVPAVAHGWTLTTAPAVEQCRTEGAVAQLERILGPSPTGIDRAADLLDRAGSRLRPEGRPLYAGVLSQAAPPNPLGAAWRCADRLREYRGDAHTAAWTTAGLDAVEIGLLTELYWGLPMRTYVRSRAWNDDQLDAATERLEGRGWIAGGALTPAGREAREAVEEATDRQCQPILDALGDGLEELLAILVPISAMLRQGAAYPAAGPHDLARR